MTRRCLWCSSPLDGRRDRKFCTPTCRTRHHKTIVYLENAGRFWDGVRRGGRPTPRRRRHA